MRAVKGCFGLGYMVKLMVLTAVLVALSWGDSQAVTYNFTVISSLDDTFTHDANPGDGVCSDGWEVCTLRAALEEAIALTKQNNSDTVVIKFSRPMDIYLDPDEGDLSAMMRTTVDASQHWQGNDRPGVTLHGTGQKDNGFKIIDQSIIQGLLITGFNEAGVFISSGTNSLVGGTQYGQRNYINRCGYGVIINGTYADDDEEGLYDPTKNPPDNNRVQGNYIGLAHDKDEAAPNDYGIFVYFSADGNIIGGASSLSDYHSPGNIIVGNNWHGIHIAGVWTDGNVVAGNYVGIDPQSGELMPNGRYGIMVESSAMFTQIGGAGYPGNYIYGSGWSGICLNWSGFTNIESNYIYLNNHHGIYSRDSWDVYVYDNEIGHNAGTGVTVDGSLAQKNLISANSITENVGQGVALLNGANNNMPAPVIDSIVGGVVRGRGSGGALVVELYEDPADEGQTYLGAAIVDQVSGTWVYAGGGLSGPFVTALARDSQGNTSEFSSALGLAGGGVGEAP